MIKKLFKDKSVVNMLYLLFDKFSRMVLGVIVFTLMAKQFGPEKFGELNYALSYVYIFLAMSTLGMQGVIVRDLVSGKIENSIIIGTSLSLRVISSVLFFFLCVGVYIYSLDYYDDFQMKIIVILSSVILFSFSDIIKYWFESNVASKYVVITENMVFYILSAVKISLLYINVNFYAYIYMFFLEAIIMCISLFIIYRIHCDTIKLNLNYSYIKKLLKESAPLLVASAAWVVYTRIDLIFIGKMLESKDVGVYATATKISDIFAFIPVIIMVSYAPVLQKITDKIAFNRSFQKLYNNVVLVMLFVAIVVTNISNFFISFAFGEDFESSSEILNIYIWGGVFSALAIVSGRYLLLKGKQNITMYRHIVGLLINCPLNYILIANFGVEGAAMATLISLIISNYILDAFSRETRLIFQQKSHAILMLWVVRR